jgi:hypothetical protein
MVPYFFMTACRYAFLRSASARRSAVYERADWLGKPCITVRDDALRSRRQVDVVCDLYERDGWSICHEDEENFLGFVFFLDDAS